MSSLASLDNLLQSNMPDFALKLKSEDTWSLKVSCEMYLHLRMNLQYFSFQEAVQLTCISLPNFVKLIDKLNKTHVNSIFLNYYVNVQTQQGLKNLS